VSERYDCTDPGGRAEGVPAAAAAIRRGEVVVLPTDTVYGIGCDAFDATAVASVLAAKGRGRDMPPPVLIPTARTAQGLATAVPDYAQQLMETFWPGPLTVVLKAQTSLHWDLGETNGTVALRVPDHEVTLELLGEVGPMAVTSANTTGDPAARTVDEALAMLGETVSVYLDAGPASVGEPSTIIDCTGEVPVTLRLGAIPQADIDAALAPSDDATVADDAEDDGATGYADAVPDDTAESVAAEDDAADSATIPEAAAGTSAADDGDAFDHDAAADAATIAADDDVASGAEPPAERSSAIGQSPDVSTDVSTDERPTDERPTDAGSATQ